MVKETGVVQWKREMMRSEPLGDGGDEVRVVVRRMPEAAKMVYQPLTIYCDRCEDRPTLMVLKYGRAQEAGGQSEMAWSYEYEATGSVPAEARVKKESAARGEEHVVDSEEHRVDSVSSPGETIKEPAFGENTHDDDAYLDLLLFSAPAPVVDEGTLRGIAPEGLGGTDEFLRAREREDGAVQVSLRCPACGAGPVWVTLQPGSSMEEALRRAAVHAHKLNIPGVLPLSAIAKATSGKQTGGAEALTQAIDAENRARGVGNVNLWIGVVGGDGYGQAAGKDSGKGFKVPEDEGSARRFLEKQVRAHGLVCVLVPIPAAAGRLPSLARVAGDVPGVVVGYVPWMLKTAMDAVRADAVERSGTPRALAVGEDGAVIGTTVPEVQKADRLTPRTLVAAAIRRPDLIRPVRL